MSNELIFWLQEWYKKNCNGMWEQTYGINIETLDNPGWSVTVDLASTELEFKFFEVVDQDNGEKDWLFCEVKDKRFVGNGDPNKLKNILEIFQEWTLQNTD